MDKVRKNKTAIFVFLFPSALLFLAIIILPIFMSGYYSLLDWDGITSGTFVGIQNYIELFTEKIECCGCGACMNVCSKEAISMKKDEYGFVYPRINMEKCIGCGACKKVCAFRSNTIKNKPQKVYAIASKNHIQRTLYIL